MNPQDKPGGPRPRSLGALVALQARAQGHQPFLTYYDDVSGERTELSFATFDNWVSKTANLLAEQAGAARGRSLSLGLVDHWIGAVVVASAWKLGTPLRLGIHDSADIVVVAERDRAGVRDDHPGLVVVGDGMGGRTEHEGPGVAYGDEVLAFGDDYDDPDVTMDDPAVLTPEGVLTHDAVYAAVSGALPADARLLLARPLNDGRPRLAMAMCAGASLVWCPHAGGRDLAQRAADERVTHVAADDGSIQPV